MRLRKIKINLYLSIGTTQDLQDRGKLMIKVRCEKCGRLLCEIDSKVKIKCRKCGYMNYIVVNIADQASQSKI